MQRLQEYLKKRLTVDDDIMFEGLDIVPGKKIIRLDDSTKGVDFNGPILWKTDDDIDVISIFKRTSLKNFNKEVDGNPFIYALKKRFEWKFEISNEEIVKYLRKFINNCKKLQQSYDTIIMIPSSNDLNERFMNYLYSTIKASYKIEKLFRKIELNHDELEQFVDYDSIKKDFSTDYSEVELKVEDILYDINDNHKEFEAKKINKKYLKYIKFLQINDDPNSVEHINDKNILILDDVFSSGATISNAVNAIKQNYNPKSITVVTLLSKKF